MFGGSGWGEWSHLLPSIFQGKWLQLLPSNSSFIKAFEKVSANSRAGPGLTAGGPSPSSWLEQNWQAADGASVGSQGLGVAVPPRFRSRGRDRPFVGFPLARTPEESPPTHSHPHPHPHLPEGLQFPRWGVRRRISPCKDFAQMLKLPQVFSCDINQTAALSWPCWSTAFIRVPKGPLSLDLRTFGCWNRDIRSARKAPGLWHSEGHSWAFPECFPGFGSTIAIPRALSGFLRTLQQPSLSESQGTGICMEVSEDTNIWHMSRLL